MSKKKNEVKALPQEYSNQLDYLGEFTGYGNLLVKKDVLLFDKSMVQDVILILLDIALYPVEPKEMYSQSYILLVEQTDGVTGMVVIGGEYLTPKLEMIFNKRKTLLPVSFILRKGKAWSIYPATVEK